MKVPEQRDCTLFWSTSDQANGAVLDQSEFCIFMSQLPLEGLALGCTYRDPNGELHTLLEHGQVRIPVNAWTHIAVTRTNNTYRFYCDGRIAHKITDSKPELPNTRGWIIGGRRRYGVERFSGLIDEVRVSRTALESSEFLNAKAISDNHAEKTGATRPSSEEDKSPTTTIKPIVRTDDEDSAETKPKKVIPVGDEGSVQTKPMRIIPVGDENNPPVIANPIAARVLASGSAGQWDQFTLSNASIQNGFVRVEKNGHIRTRNQFGGALDIRARVRARRKSVRIFAYQGGTVIFNWEVKPGELRVHRPNGVNGQGNTLGTSASGRLPINQWHWIRWKVTTTGMDVHVDGKIVFSEHRNATELNYKLNEEWVGLHGLDSVFEVSSLVIEKADATSP